MRYRSLDGKSVELTFDDGPHPQGTPAVLELLREADVKATFFLVGEQVAARPSLAGEIAAAGHRIGVHCYRHRNLLRLGPRAVREDLDRAAAVITAATAPEPSLYRPPYGIFNAASIRYVALHGLEPVLWTRWGRDWERRATAASIHAKLTAKLSPGDVLLLHDADYYGATDSWRNTIEALPAVLETVTAHGLVTA